jgi:cytoplasmic iron level regulating protein YaaA (DUF328/UPF0246 family)
LRHILLISCVKSKRQGRAKARDLYVSNLFRKWWAYGQTLHPDRVYILSALYGLLDPDQEVEPYEKTLNRMKAPDVRAWADDVFSALRQVADPESDGFTFLCGERYRRYLVPRLRNVKIPLHGMGNGRQLAFMKRALAE